MSDGQLTFEWVSPNDLHDWWERIREGLLVVKKHGDHWIPEDIYLAIKNQTAYLAVGLDPDYQGFVITQNQQSYDGPILHVWAAYGEKFNILFESAPFVEEWAKAINANRITFDSSRKGWGRMAKKIGYYPTTTRYEKRVS